MTDAAASPSAARLAVPGWLDVRLVLGVLLVLVSVVVGARLTAQADTSESVWVVGRDLAAGSTLTADDLRATRVRLLGEGPRYLLAGGPAPTGWVLRHAVSSGELLPRAALARPDDPGLARREVAVPVTAGHLPDDLAAGQQVDVYVTPGTGTGTGTGSSTAAPTGSGSPDPATRLVLAGVPVALRSRSSGLTSPSSAGVVLSVPDASAAVLVAAVQQGRVDLVRVPRGEDTAALAPAG